MPYCHFCEQHLFKTFCLSFYDHVEKCELSYKKGSQDTKDKILQQLDEIKELKSKLNGQKIDVKELEKIANILILKAENSCKEQLKILNKVDEINENITNNQKENNKHFNDIKQENLGIALMLNDISKDIKSIKSTKRKEIDLLHKDEDNKKSIKLVKYTDARQTFIDEANNIDLDNNSIEMLFERIFNHDNKSIDKILKNQSHTNYQEVYLFIQEIKDIIYSRMQKTNRSMFIM
jgi:hypothetical protein